MQTPKGAAAVSIAVSAARRSAGNASDLPDVIVSLASGSCLRLQQVGFGAGSELSRCLSWEGRLQQSSALASYGCKYSDRSCRVLPRSEAGPRQVQVLVQHPRGIVAMAAHPRLPLVAMASSRSIVLWDCVRQERLCGLEAGSGTGITTLSFGHKNNWLAVGTESGGIMMLTADTLEHCYDLKQVKKVLRLWYPVAVSCIASFCRAHELLIQRLFVQSVSMTASDAKSNFLAAATVNRVIILFSWQPAKQRFLFAGSCKAALAPVSLCFGEDPAGRTQLLSIGTDVVWMQYVRT